ncbi:hypothetical protein C8R45DRAFT_926785 [Mycena sanguinolenta]|nr:hypothetical protein C8R45DRAFT_926785 [Mycena sanguinolenta]
MHFPQILVFVLAAVGSVSAICADGQIGIGAEQLSSIGSPGTGSNPASKTALAAGGTTMAPPSHAAGAPPRIVVVSYALADGRDVRRGNPVSARTGDSTSWTCVGGGGQNCGEAPFGVTSVWTCCNRD